MSVRLLAVLLVVLALTSGCGAEQGDGQAESQERQTTTAVRSAIVSGGWGVEMAEPDLLDEEVTLASRLAVFDRPRKPADEYAGGVMELPRGADSAEGRELAEQSRVLLRDVAKEKLDELGSQSLSLYAVPTDRGWVCAYIVYDELGELAVGGGCEHGLVEGLGLELQGEGKTYRLYGVVEDSVDRAWVEIGERRLPARVGGNGIFFEAKTTEVCPVDIAAILVERSGGERTSIPWAELAPGLVGSERASFGCR